MLLLTDGVANSWRKGALLHWMIAYPSRVSAQGINVSVVCVCIQWKLPGDGRRQFITVPMSVAYKYIILTGAESSRGHNNISKMRE